MVDGSAGRDRRPAGIITLILALVAVAVLPLIDGRRVGGTPVALTFPPPPQPGDCAVPPFPEIVGNGGQPVEIPITDLHFGSCAGLIVGEIVSSRGGRASSKAQPVRTELCLGSAPGFAGLKVSTQSATLPGVPTGDPVEWMPTVGANTYRVVPGDVERAAGHDWVACLSTPTGNRPYLGTLRAAYTTGRLPVQFGLCWAGIDLDAMPALVSCTEPHAAELLATGWIPDRSVVPLPDIEASCMDLAGRMMRTDDPTRRGALTVVLDQVTFDGAFRPTDPLAVNCFAAASGGAQLTGTVIGLADGPVPLAG